ncbi:hypothetical protein Zmor_010182 [Zophobas morio]|uniref:Uncharacterized protein n=1 Tax=Zophobas morio TaxID=2755281 RepID=A0AA38MJP1_9CUCU|nr:hypothetical protein Zmor_010182 [Zophobas morio]
MKRWMSVSCVLGVLLKIPRSRAAALRTSPKEQVAPVSAESDGTVGTLNHCGWQRANEGTSRIESGKSGLWVLWRVEKVLLGTVPHRDLGRRTGRLHGCQGRCTGSGTQHSSSYAIAPFRLGKTDRMTAELCGTAERRDPKVAPWGGLRAFITFSRRFFRRGECRFTNYSPSLVACASVVSALCGLGWVNKYDQSQETLMKKLADIIDVQETYFVEELVQSIDQMIKQNLEDSKDCKTVCDDVSRSEQCTPPPAKMRDFKTATTPTDVHDVCF